LSKPSSSIQVLFNAISLHLISNCFHIHIEAARGFGFIVSGFLESPDNQFLFRIGHGHARRRCDLLGSGAGIFTNIWRQIRNLNPVIPGKNNRPFHDIAQFTNISGPGISAKQCHGFIANRFESIHGILNGTSNYILTRMTDAGLDFADALAEAQALGYAEADPTFDVNGWDAAHKAIILASLAYGFWVRTEDVYVAGIDSLTSDDIRFSAQLGYVIKLLATIKADAAGSIEVRVCPTLIPKGHVLASVNGVFNAVWLRGDVVGEALFYGRGAGQDPTASSVIADLAETVVALKSPRRCYGFTSHDLYGKLRPVEDAISQFYLRLLVDDTPGVLAQIAGILGDAGIGISSVIQPESQDPGPLPLVLMIHDATFGQMREAAVRIGELACVKAAPALLSVENFS